MKSLCLSSLIFLLIFLHCSPVRDISTPWKSPFYGSFEKALFKTTLDIRKNHLSGYTMIKKTEDSTYHIIFSNEMGMTIFDFEINPGNFKVNYLFEPMNKKVLIRIFERDFSHLIFGKIMPGQNFINKTVVFTESGSGSWPKKIILTNPGIKLEMQLRHMNL